MDGGFLGPTFALVDGFFGLAQRLDGSRWAGSPFQTFLAALNGTHGTVQMDLAHIESRRWPHE